ncbi:hypothetical protein QL093DRAFT_2146632 [Fusarium oxysporum]|nr:hypothetical protein QL093DRAFT_2146632 [Fusarium oxysporum]
MRFVCNLQICSWRRSQDPPSGSICLSPRCYRQSWKISHRFVAFDAVSDKAIMQYLPKANLGIRDEERLF